MKIQPVLGAGDDRRQRWFFAPYEQWSSLLLGHSNWYDVTLINISCEYAPYAGRWEFSLGLLGVCFTVTHVYDHTFDDQMHSLAQRARSEIEARTGCKVLDPFGALAKLEGTQRGPDDP